MKSIGIDIGTTTISFVITDNDTLTVLQKYTIAGNSFIQTGNSWERQARCTASSIQTPADMLSARSIPGRTGAVLCRSSTAEASAGAYRKTRV